MAGITDNYQNLEEQPQEENYRRKIFQKLVEKRGEGDKLRENNMAHKK